MKGFNPWHDLPIGENAPEIVESVIEISRGSRAKYELDKDSGMIRLDRVIYSSVYYPANYGFIPRTYCDDNDPLDILVLSRIDVKPLSIMRARPVGVMHMIDGGEKDDKIIAVCPDDMSVSHFHDISELPSYILREIETFFNDYKKLENKEVVIEEFRNREVAQQVIQQSIEDYKAYISKQ